MNIQNHSTLIVGCFFWWKIKKNEISGYPHDSGNPHMFNDDQTLVLQIPSEKVFRPKKTTPNTVSEGVWSCR